MKTLDWKESRAKFEELGRTAKARGAENDAFLYESLGELTEQLEHAVARLTHAEERLAFLSRQVADLESRVHEENIE
jgi:hypothetical protein